MKGWLDDLVDGSQAREDAPGQRPGNAYLPDPAQEKTLEELLYPGWNQQPWAEDRDGSGLLLGQADPPLPEGTTLAQALYPDWNQDDWGLGQPGQGRRPDQAAGWWPGQGRDATGGEGLPGGLPEGMGDIVLSEQPRTIRPLDILRRVTEALRPAGPIPSATGSRPARPTRHRRG